MQKKIITKIIVVFSIIAAFTFTCCTGIFASDTASLTLICKKANTILTGMNWDIYYVGQRTGDTYRLEGLFANYPVSINPYSVDSMASAALTLENYAIVDEIPYENSGYIDKEGYLKFPALKSGLYLVCGDIFNIAEVFYQPSPTLVEIDTDTENPDIDLIVYPKIKYALLSEVNLNNSLKKLWIDSKETHEPVHVKIFKNGDVYKTVELNEENEWQYNWTATEYAQWRTKEIDIPPQYTVNYYSDNGKFVVENKFNGVEETVTTAAPQKLPQTGQLWWPVIAMGSVGTASITIGMRLRYKKRRKR